MNIDHSSPSASARLLEHFRAPKQRLPLHPLEKAVLAAVAIHLCFLPWALGTMHPWSQITSLVMASIGMFLALVPRNYTGDYAPGIVVGGQTADDRQQSLSGRHPPSVIRHQSAAFRLSPLPRLLHFPIFWIGLALLGYIALQASNPSWVWTRNATSWWLVRVNDIEWLPTSIESPFERFNIWRQFIIYASAWLTVCTVWTGFTRRKSLQLLMSVVLANVVLLSLTGFVQKISKAPKVMGVIQIDGLFTPFASFIYKNHAGAYFALMTLIAVSLAIWTFLEGERASRKSTPAGLYFFCALVLSVTVIFSFSRGAILLLGAAWFVAGFWFWLSRRHARSGGATHPGVYVAIVSMFLGVIGITFREVDFSAIQARFDSLAKNYKNVHSESVQSRIQAHAAANTMLADYWIRGVGAGGFRFLFPEYIKNYPEIYASGRFYWEHAHSDWREIPIELGAPGSALLLLGGGWWLLVFYRGRAVWHSLVVPIMIGCSQTLIHAWFDFPFQCPAILCTWLALIAVSARWLELDAG